MITEKLYCAEHPRTKATHQCQQCGEYFCKNCYDEHHGECPYCDPYLYEIEPRVRICDFKNKKDTFIPKALDVCCEFLDKSSKHRYCNNEKECTFQEWRRQ